MALMIFTENLLSTKAVLGPFIIISPQLLIINVGSILNLWFSPVFCTVASVPAIPWYRYLSFGSYCSISGFLYKVFRLFFKFFSFPFSIDWNLNCSKFFCTKKQKKLVSCGIVRSSPTLLIVDNSWSCLYAKQRLITTQ